MCVWANILKLLMSQIISNLPGSLVCPHKKFSGYPCSLAQEGRTSASSMILQGSSTLLLPTYFFFIGKQIWCRRVEHLWKPLANNKI